MFDPSKIVTQQFEVVDFDGTKRSYDPFVLFNKINQCTGGKNIFSQEVLDEVRAAAGYKTVQQAKDTDGKTLDEVQCYSLVKEVREAVMSLDAVKNMLAPSQI